MNTGRRNVASNGIQTAALGFGGASPPTTRLASTESYDGTTWTNVNSLINARSTLGGAGTQTAGLAFGGYTTADGATGISESWDGTNWSTAPTMGTARQTFGYTGTQTAALAAGGAPVRNITEEFTGGTSITTASDLTTS